MLLKGRWRLDALIGVGGMAAVYAATHRNGSRVAIKVLNPEFTAQPEFVARFMREGYVANKIDHPASVRVIDDDNEDGVAFLVMELLSGHSLERYARRAQVRLPLAQVMFIGDQVLDLLAVAHGHGILHRDIKPANIHMTATGQVKVLDFGIARLAEQMGGEVAATVTGAALGTPAYMPPEQARGRWQQVDPRTDLWALGATLHALVLGDRPRRAETVQEEMLLAMTAPLPSLRETMPNAPPALIDFIARATAFEMDGRWSDAPTMQRALRQVVEQVNLPMTAPVQFGGTPSVDGPNPATGSGGSGPKVDTAPMVFGRDPSTLHATESSQSATPPARSRIMMPAMVFVVTLVAAVAVGVKVFVPTVPPTTAAASPPVAPSAPNPLSTPSSAGPTAADPSPIELPVATPSAAAPSTTPATSSQAPRPATSAPTEAPAAPSATHHHHSRPAPIPSAASADNPFDERF
jgi:serine/threonine-protein kinase